MWKVTGRDEGNFPIFGNDEGWQVDFDPMNQEWFVCSPEEVARGGIRAGYLFAELGDALRSVDAECGRPWGNPESEPSLKADGDIPPEPTPRTPEETLQTEEDFLNELRGL